MCLIKACGREGRGQEATKPAASWTKVMLNVEAWGKGERKRDIRSKEANRGNEPSHPPGQVMRRRSIFANCTLFLPPPAPRFLPVFPQPFGLATQQTQNVMYDMVSELQERNEDLEKRISALEGKIDMLGLTLHALPSLVSQAIRHQQQEGLLARACSTSNSSDRSSWTPTRQRKSPSTVPHTSSDSSG